MLKKKEHLRDGSGRGKEEKEIEISNKVCFNDNYFITTVHSEFVNVCYKLGGKSSPNVKTQNQHNSEFHKGTFEEEREEFFPISPSHCPKRENLKLCTSLIMFIENKCSAMGII